jgi:hypothetical protein
VRINQNHHRFWSLRAGTGTIVNDKGQLCVDLAPGAHDLTLYYWPAHLGWFLLSSALGLPLSLILWGWLQRRERRTRP